MSIKRRLTPRQTAILAAIERRGCATLVELRDDFPELAPSVVASVLEALVRRQLVRASGDPSLVYVGGVQFRPARRSIAAVPNELDDLARRVIAVGGWQVWVDYSGLAVYVLVPLSEIQDGILGIGDSRFEQLQHLVGDLASDASVSSFGLESQLSVSGGEAALQLRLGLEPPPLGCEPRAVAPSGHDDVDVPT